ncbi:MAG: universal stress protein, partial [Rhodothermales bacterium]|nr:universal stress protein [Rhodothermales bacterium]
MLQIQTLLFPTDLSACAERAFAHASHLAQASGARVHALHVRPPGTPALQSGTLLPLSLADVADDLRLPEGGAGSSGPDAADVVEAQVERENEVEAILDYARAHEADLIVMGTHGRRGLDRALAGSVAERVVREASCPVLTVRHCPEAAVHRVLVPTDFSGRAREAAAYAVELAKAYGARLELLHVVEEAALPSSFGPVLGAARVGAQEVKARSKEAMRRWVRELQDGVAVDGTVMVGHPARDIVDYAEG